MEIRNTYIAKMATGNVEEDQFLIRFSQYLYTTIHRTSRAYWARVHLRESVEVPLESVQALHEDSDKELLLEALHSLTDKQRDVLERHYFDEHSIREIAVESNVALITIYKRLTKALDAMRKYLRREDD